MTNSARPVVIAGNWKMYKTIEESIAYIKELIPLVKDSKTQVYLAVPFTSINPLSKEVDDTKITIGAQNMNDVSEGAFTGEIAGPMLKDAGAKFVILGHSERRRLFDESNTFINKKVKRALKDGLQPILCIGETEEQRAQSKTDEVLAEQMTQCLEGINAEQIATMIIAYEPIWAIGSEVAATPAIAQETMHTCREFIAKTWNEEAANHVVWQYGGSVKAENAKMFLDQEDIDGLLVGGASLSAEKFSKIVNYQEVLVE